MSTFKGATGQGIKVVLIFTLKRTPLREFTSFEPFCVKIGLGSDLRACSWKKSESLRLPCERHVAVNTGIELPFSLWQWR